MNAAQLPILALPYADNRHFMYEFSALPVLNLISLPYIVFITTIP